MNPDATRQVRYSRDASRTLRRIDRRTACRIRDKIALLAADPDAPANNVSALLVLKIAPRGSA